MNKESTLDDNPEVEDVLLHVQATIAHVKALQDCSLVLLTHRLGGGNQLYMENYNILPAQKAFYLSRTGMLLVNGYDEQGDLFLDGISIPIAEGELAINARDTLVSFPFISVSDVTLAGEGKGTAAPYTIDCQIIDSDVYVDELKFFPESYDSDGFKFGVSLSDGTQGEILVKLSGDAKYLTIDEIESATWSHETVSTEESTPIFQILYEMTRIKIGSFEIKLGDEDFFLLASSNSIEVNLE